MNQLITTLVRSEEWVQVRRRIFRQLIESLLYEQIISEPVIRLHATSEYVLHGESHIGEKVKYTFYAVRKESFHRIQLTDAPIMRITSLERTEADSIPQFLQEISSHFQVSEAQLGQFIDELQQTHLKDTLSKRWDHTHWKPLLSEYDEWESAMTEGHPYHPCYKSRIGFTLPDNTLYGPEFKPEFRLEWIAIQRDATIVSLSDSLITYTQFIQSELEQEWDMLMSTLQDNSLDEDTYILLPVHPWQWERIAETCADQLRTGEMVYLGQAGDTYRPQQSIRTMTNVTSRDKPYVKLPLNIVNTSSGRILAQHTIMNSARISDWLGRVVATDTFLQKEIQLIVLKEIAGVSYNHQKLPSLFEQKIYGSLGAIWRESLHPYLNDGENALPFNALCHLDLQNSPIIDPWVREYGLELG
ncbi:IucA/IucC family protein [Paenibacillus pini]|uniref:Siderophore S biosynthesis protein n=1 Tax=Paenibacillus pini JCM 16418 TaxID=1236976 RepID=W7YLE9_9BACL|nr:IucA/IucC family protein [Paenibacillus pini]GAF09392.1 siderophore S biosynthesis protein [Paenibacillus pini JCM 16418]